MNNSTEQLRERIARILHDANTGSIVPDPSDSTKYRAMAEALIAEGFNFQEEQPAVSESVDSDSSESNNSSANANKLWDFYWDCGRQGDVKSTFVATDDEIADIVGKRAYFGEILGKHSEVYGDIEEADFTMVSDDPAFVESFRSKVGSTGHCPFDYIEE